MLRNLFARREDARTVMQSPDATTSSRAPAQEYASLGPYYVAQAGPAATRLGSAPRELSPIVRAAATRITGNPVA
ncbi:MAG: hypothetical protein KY433_01225 [Actinobacteria bacterium]|nr:hypothetical protein [Actinomycetota bacterium]